MAKVDGIRNGSVVQFCLRHDRCLLHMSIQARLWNVTKLVLTGEENSRPKQSVNFN